MTSSSPRWAAGRRTAAACVPHEELNVITEGAHYGWPYCIDNGTPNPEYRGRVDCTHYKNPALLLPGHVAPLGMAFYTGSMFPAAYQNQLIVTFHGYRDYGHRLMLVPVDAQGVPDAGEPMDIIRGWEKSADGKDPRGRSRRRAGREGRLSLRHRGQERRRAPRVLRRASRQRRTDEAAPAAAPHRQRR